MWGGERWEISGHRSSPSIVVNGPLKGRSLEDLSREFGAEITGLRAPVKDRFPLLFKVIEANDRLSLQVHPNDSNAAFTGGEPKNEMWHILEAKDGAYIFAGLREGVTEETIRSAHREDFESMANMFYIKAGETYSIPGGLVHSIGPGACIYEVQQSSDTTYRLSDWDRVGPDGRERALHLEEGLKSIDYSLGRPVPCSEMESGAFSFKIRSLTADESFSAQADEGTFHALYIKNGSCTLSHEGGEVAMLPHTSILVPPGIEFSLSSKGVAHVLDTSLP